MLRESVDHLLDHAAVVAQPASRVYLDGYVHHHSLDARLCTHARGLEASRNRDGWWPAPTRPCAPTARWAPPAGTWFQDAARAAASRFAGPLLQTSADRSPGLPATACLSCAPETAAWTSTTVADGRSPSALRGPALVVV